MKWLYRVLGPNPELRVIAVFAAIIAILLLGILQEMRRTRAEIAGINKATSEIENCITAPKILAESDCPSLPHGN